MTWMPVPDIGRFGVISDTPEHLLPPGAWTTAKNIRFRNGRIFKVRGSIRVYGTPSIDPYWGINISTGGDTHWVYSDLEKLYAVSGSTHSNITRQSSNTDVDYDVDENSLWNGGNLAGILVINNGNDVPQSWVPGLTNRAVNLTGWPSDLICKVIRPFGYFLVAFNTMQGNNDRQHNRIRWSDTANPGMLPSSWDTSDATNFAGEFDLPDSTSGEIVDAVQLREWMYIYKNNATWAMRFVGGNDIFTTSSIFRQLGALSTGCVASFSYKGGEFHCVFTGDDVITHDGRSIINTLEQRYAKSISRDIDESNWDKSFVVNMPGVSENWICYPSRDSTDPNKVLIWNYSEDILSVKELPPDVSWIDLGIVTAADVDLTWDSDMENWNQDATFWNEASVQQHNLRPVQFTHDGSSKGFHQIDIGNTINNEATRETLERQGFIYMPRSGIPTSEGPVSDIESLKLFRGAKLYLTAEGAEPNEVIGTMQLGVASEINGEPEYQSEVDLIPGFNRVDTMISGRSIAYKFNMNTNKHWELHSLELDLERLGSH